MFEQNKIYLGDCLEIMKEIESNSIDLSIIDPPYIMDYQSGMRKEKFDKILGDKNGYCLIANSLKEINRVLKEGSHIYCFCSWHNIDFFKQEFEKHFELKNILIWKKKGGFIGDLETQYGVDYEFILFGYKKWYEGSYDNYESFKEIKDYFKIEKKKIEDELQIKIKDKLKWTTHFHSFAQGQSFSMPTEKNYNELQNTFTGYFLKPYELLKKEYNKRKSLNGKRISGIIETCKVLNTKYIHPTQKPTEIIEILINKSSSDGDIVLDCFLGSGTTAITCINTNRNYIGIEKDEYYYKIACDRIQNFKQ